MSRLDAGEMEQAIENATAVMSPAPFAMAKRGLVTLLARAVLDLAVAHAALQERAEAERGYRVAREAYLMACVDRRESARQAADVDVSKAAARLRAAGGEP